MSQARIKPLIVGIAGGSGSGKTYLARQVVNDLGPAHAALISMDQYFEREDRFVQDIGAINFDHPSHLNFRQLISDVKTLRAGRSVSTPTYDFQTMTQTQHCIEIEPRPVIVIEGLFILADPIVSLCDLTCFLDVADDERLMGRILRDIKERAANMEDVIDRYQRFVRPGYRIFVEPTKQNADVIVDFTFRRSFFSQMLIRLLRSFVDRGEPLEGFIEAMRSESYRPSLHPEDGFMSLTTDIFKLAKAYPEKAELRDVGRPLSSPAATSFGRKKR